MKIAGILLIAIAVRMPQGPQATQSQPTSTNVNRRQLYSPSSVRGTSPLYQRRDTWYEFLLKQFNPDDIDDGAWLEKRRQTFLEASVNNPYFKYSAGLSLGLLLMTLLAAKQRI